MKWLTYGEESLDVLVGEDDSEGDEEHVVGLVLGHIEFFAVLVEVVLVVLPDVFEVLVD